VTSSILFALCTVFGQSPAPQPFEVASVRLVAPPYPTGGGPWTVDHGRFGAQVAQVRAVIGWTYGVRGPTLVHGGPDWLDREPYDFEAKAGNPDANEDQIWAMVRTLLADRFKLAVHRETHEAQVYALVVGKSGSKMQETEGQKNYINWMGPGQVVFSEADTSGLISILSSMLESPVLDKTGLKGFYNFKLEFTDPQLQKRLQSQNGGQLPLETRPDIFAALQEQLGLKLDGTKGPVEIVVIDHVERPSQN